MKLHLPKLLRVAVLAALSFTYVAPAVAENITLTNSGTKKITGSVTVSGDDYIGYMNGDTLLTGFKEGNKTQSLTINPDTANGEIEGNLTIGGNARVAVGGGSVGSLSCLTVSSGTVTVNDNGYLIASKAVLKNLTVNSGKVEIRTGAGYGQGTEPWGSGQSTYGGSKQATISNKVTITGGELFMGIEGGAYCGLDRTKNIERIDSYHCTTGFKGSIEQTGGTMAVRGDTILGSAFTIDQKGDKTAAMYFTDNLTVTSSLAINQSNDNASLVIGRLIHEYNTATDLSSAKTITINQSGGGDIHLAQGSYFETLSTIGITQSGGGSIVIGGGVSSNTTTAAKRAKGYDNNRPNKYVCEQTAYTLNQSSGSLTVKGSASMLLSSGSIGGNVTVEANGAIGVMSDTLSGGNSAIITIEDGGSLACASGSTFNVSFSKAAQSTMLESNDIAGTQDKDFSFRVLAVSGADTNMLSSMGIKLSTMDSRLWSIKDTAWETSNGDAYVTGTLVFNPEINLTNVTNGYLWESFSDASEYLTVTLNISGNDLKLQRNNSHSGGTNIAGTDSDGIVVTLTAVNSLGLGKVTTTGTCTVSGSTSTASSRLTNLPSTIQNKGALTLKGNYKADAENLDKIEQSEAYINLQGEASSTEDGFYRPVSYKYYVVKNETGASLNVSGAKVTIGGTKYTLDSTGMAGTLATPEYKTYHMTAQNAAVSDIQTASNGSTELVKMSGAKLTVDADMEVESTGGEIAVAAGKTVAGTIENAKVSGTTGTEAAGVVTATLEGTNTLTGNLTLGGADVLSSATVKTTGVTSLSTADEVTATLTKAITNEGTLTLSGSYDVSEMDGMPLPDNFIDVYGVEGTTGFAQYNRFEVEMIQNGTNASLVLEDADVEYTKKARAAVGTLEGVLGTNGVATFVGGTDYSTYVIDNPNHQVSVSQIQDASDNQTKTVKMSDGSLTADEDIVVQTTGGNLIVVDDNDDTTDDGAVVSGTIKDTAVSAQGGTIKATIEGGTLTTTGEALVSGTVTDTEITANGGEISGAISGGTLDVSGEALVSNTVTDTEITANGGEISGTVSGGTLDVSGEALVSNTVTDTEITANGGEISGAISGGTLDVSGDAKVNGAVTGTEITAKGGEILGDITGGSLMTEAGSQISGSVTDTAITTKGGEISGTIGGTSSLTAMSGMTTLSGSGNSYNGGTVVKDGATLVVTKNGGLGTGGVTVESGATLDMKTDGDAQIEGDLTVNDNGTITLNNGSLLVVDGDVKLDDGAIIILEGEYDLNAPLVSSSTGTLTMGDVTLVYNGTTVELEMQNGQVVLVSKFKQDKANAATLSNWGIATASRAVVNAVRGQRSNTGCIANGKGTAWVASLGSKHEINGSDIDISGAAVGADMKVGRNSRIGIALGYAEGEVQPAGFSQVDQEGSYLVVYGEHGLKKLSATSCLSMDWVAAYGTTDSEVGGLKWEQDSLQLNSRVNWNKKVNNRLCMSVFGGLEYFANNSDTVDGVKTGSIQNLRGEIGVGARYVAWGTPAVTDGKSGLVLAKGCEKLVLNGEVRYMNDMVRSNPVIRMNGLSGTGENPGRQGIGIEAGATYRIGERWSATANYGFNTMEDSKEHRLNIGAAYTF